MKKVVESLFLLFTLSTVAGYFASVSYYYQYNISITPFLSIDDLTIIFTRWVWIGCLIGFIIYSAIADVNLDKESWWTKSYTKFRIMRRGLVLIPIVIIVVILSFYYKAIFDLVILSIVLIILILLSYVSISFLKEVYSIEISTFDTKKWSHVLFSISLLIIINPLALGLFNAHFVLKQNIDFVMDNGIRIDTNTSKNLKYIGQTAKYLFIYDIKTESTTVFNLEKIQTIRFSKANPEIFE